MIVYQPEEISSLIREDQEHFFHPKSDIGVLQNKGPKIMVEGKAVFFMILQQGLFRRYRRHISNQIGHSRTEIVEVSSSNGNNGMLSNI